jgi:hypothetical protein
VTALPSPADIARALTEPVNGYPPIEGREVHVGGNVVTVWEAMTYADKPGELHLDMGVSGADSWDVVLQVVSVRHHRTGATS